MCKAQEGTNLPFFVENQDDNISLIAAISGLKAVMATL
jgi:hypothetical protein